MFIFLAALLFSPIPKTIAEIIYGGIEINIYPLANLFDIYPPGTNTFFNFSFGMSVLPYRVFGILFWVFLFFALALKLIKKKENVKYNAKFASNVSLILSVCMLVCFYMPASKVTRDFDPSQANNHNIVYYGSLEKEKTGDFEKFEIQSYDMSLKIVNELSAKVKVNFTKTKDGKYAFTLYHGYRPSKIYDSDGKKLKFERNNDHIYVDLPDKEPELTFVYKGHAPDFYSNLQGICLPAGFSFYPVAGNLDVYDTENTHLNNTLPKTQADFNVKIKCIGKVFSNLSEEKGKQFKGRSNGLTIVSGLYKEITMDNVTVVYPYLNGDYSKANIENVIKHGKGKSAIKNKTVIVLPNVNQQLENIVASDHIVAHSGLWDYE